MSQHPIDLLPEAIRARAQAGVRMGRLIVAALLLVFFFSLLIIHSRIIVSHAEKRLAAVRVEAEHVIATDQRVTELSSLLDAYTREINRFNEIALPLDLSRVLATIVDALPPSVTLTEVRLNTSSDRPVGPRGATVSMQENRDRFLLGEVTGFAASDLEVAELVTRLDGIAPFSRVSLDYSRTTTIRDRSARQFRLSFRIDLEPTYEVRSPGSLADAGGGSDDQ